MYFEVSATNHNRMLVVVLVRVSEAYSAVAVDDDQATVTKRQLPSLAVLVPWYLAQRWSLSSM